MNDNYFVKYVGDGSVLFCIDKNREYSIGDKFGFNMDNAPNVWAIFTVLDIINSDLIVGLPERKYYDSDSKRQPL